jgi:Kef-type K+ transport system membrane component KefB
MAWMVLGIFCFVSSTSNGDVWSKMTNNSKLATSFDVNVGTEPLQSSLLSPQQHIRKSHRLRRHLSLTTNVTSSNDLDGDNSDSDNDNQITVSPSATATTSVTEDDRETSDAADEQQLSVDVSFEDILKTVIFLMASWMMGVLSQLIGLPCLVGEIVTGFILGPPLLDFVAYPEAMVLIGSFGLIGLLLDSGINLDIAQLRETGSRAVSMAFVGTILALGVGLGMGYAAYVSDDSDSSEDGGWFKSSFAVGAAFAPSSFGVASQVLSQGEILNTPMGQVIVAGSVFDDVLGLILLSVMEVLVMSDPTISDYIVPFISSFGYLIVLGYFGITYFPKLVEQHVLPKFSSSKTTSDFVGFSLLFILLSFYLPLMYYSGSSYLTGAFLAGLSFSQISSVHTQYLKSAPHLRIWLMRIFFAATIGFQVPIQYFTNGNVLNWGFLYGTFCGLLSSCPQALGQNQSRFAHTPCQFL